MYATHEEIIMQKKCGYWQSFSSGKFTMKYSNDAGILLEKDLRSYKRELFDM